MDQIIANRMNSPVLLETVSVDPIALKVSDLGGRDLRLERLWITEVATDEHSYIDLVNILPNGVWVAAGSSVNIMFGNTTIFDNTNNVLIVNYQPPPGKVIFKILTNLGNAASARVRF